MADRIALKRVVCKGSLPGPRLLITGGVHGDEFEPMAAVRRLVRELSEQKLVGTVTLVPVVNENAFDRGSRTADDGIDLARICPGNAFGSATERLADQLSQLICASDYYIDLHSGGTQLSVYPLAGYMVTADQNLVVRQHQMARAFNLPLVWGSDGTLDGRTLSVARDAGIPAIYVEYHGAAVCDRLGVQAMVDGCFGVMTSLQMVDRASPASRVVHEVQQSHANSGFLQLSHPAPCSGFFEATVLLGDHLKAGETMGWVVDPLGDQPVEILAETTGMVICLRTFPTVAKGDSLGYVLDTGAKLGDV